MHWNNSWIGHIHHLTLHSTRCSLATFVHMIRNTRIHFQMEKLKDENCTMWPKSWGNIQWKNINNQTKTSCTKSNRYPTSHGINNHFHDPSTWLKDHNHFASQTDNCTITLLLFYNIFQNPNVIAYLHIIQALSICSYETNGSR